MKSCKSIITRMNAFFVHRSSFTRFMGITAGKLSVDTKALYSPVMSAEEIGKIDSVLGVHIGLTSISWARMEVKNNNLTHLDYQMFPENMNKMDANEIYFYVRKWLESVPKADRYVIELFRKPFSNAQGQLHMLLQATRLQVMSTLSTMLNHESRDEDIHPVIFMKFQVAGKLFGLLLGSELMACQNTVIDLLTDEFQRAPKPNTVFYKVETSTAVRSKYVEAQGVGKELMGRAFLEALAFTELVIHQNPESHAQLNGRPPYDGRKTIRGI